MDRKADTVDGWTGRRVDVRQIQIQKQFYIELHDNSDDNKAETKQR